MVAKSVELKAVETAVGTVDVMDLLWGMKMVVWTVDWMD